MQKTMQIFLQIYYKLRNRGGGYSWAIVLWSSVFDYQKSRRLFRKKNCKVIVYWYHESLKRMVVSGIHGVKRIKPIFAKKKRNTVVEQSLGHFFFTSRR